MSKLDNLRTEAKRWLKALRANDPEARARFEREHPNPPAEPGLRDVQHALARERGASGWAALKSQVRYAELADDMVTAYASADAEALKRMSAHAGYPSTVEDLRAIVWRNIYKTRQTGIFAVDDAQSLIASRAGFANWDAFLEAVSHGAPPDVPSYAHDTAENKITPRRDVSPGEWDEIAEAMREHRIAALRANGFLTDEALASIASLDHVTSLDLSGCRRLTDDGLQHLARMPQLEHLDLSEYPGGKLTDRGLEVLRHLPNLRTFRMSWQQGISDAGAANLGFCEKLEGVYLMGSPTGDGVIDALRGKAQLHCFETGRLATDTGLAMLREFPLFRAAANREDVRLLIDGPFTNDGLARLSGLDGLNDLDLFRHVTEITPEGFAVLAGLPNLLVLGCDETLSDDAAMPHIAAIPRLRKLRAQSSVATDEGFIALSRSQTLEEFWGRVCPHFTGQGFLAFSRMPSLRTLGIGCANVEDAALASLPDFPALRKLTPIGVRDEGFRHVGQCTRLEELVCMYCRDTTDVATEHVAGLRLRRYYAGLTQITDRSLRILGRMESLESIEFYEALSITDEGLPYLAALPRLRELQISGSPKVSFAGTGVFPAHVRVQYNL